MAWNEPGGNKDPWGNSGKGKNNQGPPDLDEALKNVSNKLKKIFGEGGGSNDGGDRGGWGLPPAFGAALLVIFIIWLGFNAILTIDEQQRGVVLRFGEFHEIMGPGLQVIIPFVDQVEPVNVTKVRSRNFRDLMLTEDENIVQVTLTVQYVVGSPRDFVVNVRDPENSLDHATESAVRHVVGSSTMHEILTEGREVISVEVQERLQNYLDLYETGLTVTKVNVEETQAPREVQAAFFDVIKAREDEQRAKNEAEAYQNAIIPEARGRAQRILEEANAYRSRVVSRAQGEAERFLKLLEEYQKAPEVTRQRLYLDAIGEVLDSTSKILIDVDGSGNMFYLPMDKIIERQPTTSAAAPSAFNRLGQDEISNIADRVIEQIRQRQADRRVREGRQ